VKCTCIEKYLNSDVSYNYQVDLFIEIDSKFIELTGGGAVDSAGITLNAYNYINALVTAANVIYESEIDTHLHVNTIKLSNLYDLATGRIVNSTGTIRLLDLYYLGSLLYFCKSLVENLFHFLPCIE
jgi:hypothetical protein